MLPTLLSALTGLLLLLARLLRATTLLLARLTLAALLLLAGILLVWIIHNRSCFIFFPATGKHYGIAELHSNHFVAAEFYSNISTEAEGIHFHLNSLILHADHRHSLKIALQTCCRNSNTRVTQYSDVMPIVQDDQVRVRYNLRTAEVLGLKVPATLLALADKVIE